MSFRPGKKPAAGVDNEDLLLDKPLTDAESSKLTALLEKVRGLKEEAIKARGNLGAGDDDEAVDVQ